MYDLLLPHSMSGLIFFWFFRKNITEKVGEEPYIKYILFFKLRGLENKLAIKDIYEKQDMLNKSHPLMHSADIR